MNIKQIRDFLERLHNDPAPLDPRFCFDRYEGERTDHEVKMFSKNNRYVTVLAKLMAALRSSRLLTIGALYGTTESYLLQCEGGRDLVAEITICDVDMADYNANRDNGSIIYRNICGTKYGAFDREFTFIRGSSLWPGVKRKIAALGPYDLIFVDGEHSAEAVYSDLELSSSSLIEGGTILVHDTSLHSSSVPRGWTKWATDHNDGWVCDAVDDSVFPFGLGYVQRKAEQNSN